MFIVRLFLWYELQFNDIGMRCHKYWNKNPSLSPTPKVSHANKRRMQITRNTSTAHGYHTVPTITST
eukprot:55142-Amphidinium_carterae.1